MNAPLLGMSVLVPVAAFLAGCVFGQVYFHLLRRDVERMARGGGGISAFAMASLRFVFAALVFAMLARYGALSLLAGFGGFLLMRAQAVRAARGTG